MTYGQGGAGPMGLPPALRPGSGPLPDPYRTRKIIGLLLWLTGQAVGGGLFLLIFILLPLISEDPMGTFAAMAVGAVIAFPAMVVYLTFPRLLDRYAPEPWYALLLALSWGGFAACGFSALINSVVGAFGSTGEMLSVVISAPFVEEFFKGLMVLGIFYFLRQEFDGVVDGIIYATFVAIGFAATENVIYYAESLHGGSVFDLAMTVFIRGFLGPWGHPLYTSMTGIGLGLAREAENKFVRFTAPFIGYGCAVFLHMMWNGTAFFAGEVFLFLLPLWFLFVAAFVIMVLVLVARRGRIIRAHLIDEVALRHISQAELDYTCSLFGGFTAFFRRGRKGTEFVRAIARLGLSKWHTARAMRGQNQTVSMDFIIPLRARIAELRSQGASPAG